MNQPTDEQIIQVLAEAEGYNLEEYRMEEGNINTAPLPDYLNDHNAIARVWKILKPFQRTENAMNIRRVVKEEMDTPENQNPDTGRLDDMHFYGATPRQHAIALARTLKPELFR
jgi:hypothetical protein